MWPAPTATGELDAIETNIDKAAIIFDIVSLSEFCLVVCWNAREGPWVECY